MSLKRKPQDDLTRENYDAEMKVTRSAAAPLIPPGRRASPQRWPQRHNLLEGGYRLEAVRFPQISLTLHRPIKARRVTQVASVPEPVPGGFKVSGSLLESKTDLNGDAPAEEKKQVEAESAEENQEKQQNEKTKESSEVPPKQTEITLRKTEEATPNPASDKNKTSAEQEKSVKALTGPLTL